jgi:DNA-binding NarL/FixJ family response regulator
MITVVLADDQVLLRAGLRALLEAEDDIEIAGEAGDGAQAVCRVRQSRPDIVLMDIRMPGADGLAATREILADPALTEVRVVMLTTFDPDEYVFEAIRSGASGFLVKNTEPSELVRAVRVAAAGDALLSPGVTRRLMRRFETVGTGPHSTAAARWKPGSDQLTDREREVVALVAQGMPNDEIGARLSMSPLTAKTHVSRAMVKLAARDRAGLVVFAYESGLVKPGRIA